MMSKGLPNCCYNKIKLLYKLSASLWFIEKHALEDSKKAHDEKCFAELEELKKDLEKHVEKMKQLLCKDIKV